MRKRRWFVGLAVLALMAGACTGDEGSGASGSQEQITLDFWLFEEGFDDYTKALVDRFEAANPKIDIKVTAYPEAQYGTKVDTALAAGDPPDIGLVFNRLWMEEGLVLPVDDVVEEENIDLSSYNPAIVGGEGSEVNAEFGCSYDGKLYCLGSYTGVVMTLYNKDMFDAAGVEHPAPWPPQTTDEFVETACNLTNPDKEVWGAAYGDPVTWLPWETFVSDDGRTAMGYVNGDTSVHAHEVLAQAIREGCAPSLNILDPWEQGGDFFSQGKLAMVVTDFQGLKKIEKAGINYGVTAPATPEGEEPFFNVWTDSIGIFSGTEHPEEAKQFIAFQTTEGQRLRVKLRGDVPISTEVAKDLNWDQGIPGRNEALEVLPHARAAVFIPNRWDTFGPIFDAFGLIVGQEKSAQAALDAAAPAIQENLDKEWQQWEEQASG